MTGDEEPPDAPVEPGPPPSSHVGPLLGWLCVTAWATWWIREEAIQSLPDPGEGPRDAWSPSSPDFPVLCIGACLLAVAVVLLLRGTIRSRVLPVRGPSWPYRQAAVLWLALEATLHLPDEKHPAYGLGPLAYFLLPFAAVGLAAAWPVLRGINFRRVAVSLGLIRGAGIGREVAIGLLAYPVLLVVEETTIALYHPPPPPSHWVIEWLTDGDGFLRWYALGSVLLDAPIVEEIAFRGLLYRFFRDATGRIPRAAGISVSVLGTAFLFAVCHLQGWEQVPLLMVFGAMAALLREWRRSLIAPMVLHLACWLHTVALLAMHGML